MRAIDITDNKKLISLGFGLKTKSGSLWRTRGGGFRIDWKKVIEQGLPVKTHFGTYTVATEEKINKKWYWTLTDGFHSFTITRDQARKNKKMPKNAVIKEAVAIKEQLLLMPPKEVIDLLVEEADRFVIEHNRNNVTKAGKPKKRGMLLTFEERTIYCTKDLTSKISFLAYVYRGMKAKEIYRVLVNAYHPDKSHRNTNEEFAEIARMKPLFIF